MPFWNLVRDTEHHDTFYPFGSLKWIPTLSTAFRNSSRATGWSLMPGQHVQASTSRRVCRGLAIIVTSGTSIEVQIAAVVAHVIGVAIEEVILVSNVVTPSRTQAALRRLHELAVAHKHDFVAAILAVVGLSLVFRGMAGH